MLLLERKMPALDAAQVLANAKEPPNAKPIAAKTLWTSPGRFGTSANSL